MKSKIRSSHESPTAGYVSQPICPWCRDTLVRGVMPQVCAWCHALHHRECFAEYGRCAACEAGEPVEATPAPSRGRATSPTRPRHFERERRPPTHAVLRLSEMVTELDEHLETFRFKWWQLLLPHLYIPIFWPIFLLSWFNGRQKAQRLLERIAHHRSTWQMRLLPHEVPIVAEATAWVS